MRPALRPELTQPELRPFLFSIAYGMLGTVSDAEDIVQEAFLRLEVSGSEVDAPKAWLAKVVTHLSIDHLRSARVRRERYVGDWLPEPIVTEVGDPMELADELSQALVVVLETLSPAERAVLLLRDVFDLPFSDISLAVGKTEANCRQLAVRARRRVEAKKPRFSASTARQRQLADRFLAACQEGDLEELTRPLAEDAALLREDRLGLRLRRVAVNGQPAAVCADAEGRLPGVSS